MSPLRHARLSAGAAPLALAIALAATGTAAKAQQTTDLPTVASPLRVQEDPNGVNLVDGKIVMPAPTLSAPGASHLSFSRVQDVSPVMSGKVSGGGGADYSQGNYSVHAGGGSSEGFRCTDFDCAPATGTGSILNAFAAGGGQYRQAGTGALYHFNIKGVNSLSGSTRTTYYYASSIDYPNGETITFSYDSYQLTTGVGQPTFYRPNQVVSSLGYYINISYQTDDFYQNAWSSPAQATLYSSSDPSTPIGRLTYSGNTITDLAGRVFACNCQNGLGAALEVPSGSLSLPGEASPALQVTASAQTASFPIVGSVVKDGVPWTYTYANPTLPFGQSSWTYSSVTVSGPNGYNQTYYTATVANSPTSKQLVLTSSTDSLGRQTTYQFDAAYRPVEIVKPEGNKINLVYDDWGNVISKTTTPKAGSGLSAQTETAYVDATNCANTGAPVLCYRPVYTRDAAGRQTDYVYNTAGQVTEKTEPADATGVRRKTYITYESLTGISRPSVVRICGDITTCTTPDEVRTEYTYWGATQLPLTESRVDARTGTTLTTTYSYDNSGRVLSKDGPLPGTDDADYYIYDILGRKTWEIAAKGTNGLRMAKRFTYRDADDKVVATENGTVADPANPVLTVLARGDSSYDSRRNPVRDALSASGVTYGVSERAYDDRGHLVCEAQRMNPSLFGNAADACTATALGSYGADRIVHNLYDAAGQLLRIQRAYGTSIQQDYATYEYTPNGKQKAVIDANGNRAEMTWDGLDRERRWIFPSPSGGGVANQSDYEEYGYDALGNRTSLRKRDGITISFQYDGMNRVTSKAVPQSASGAAGYSVYYGYDVRGLQTYARFGSSSGAGTSTAYDGFGRITSTSTNMDGVTRSITNGYNAAGDRTSLLATSGHALNFVYDAADRMTEIREPSGASDVRFAYDAASRRQSLQFGQGATTSAASFGYDAVDRLTTLGQDLAGTSSDQSLTFAYNPAAQMISRTGSNDSYAANTAYNVSRPYSVNGLNQYTAAGAAGFAYDANGNLTSDGSTAFVYDGENRLVSASGAKSAGLSYDPNGRLWQVTSSAGTTRFVYDGDHILEEYDGAGNRLRAYAHGPGSDEPLLWWEGSAGWARRSFHADHQGSIIAIADDASGSAVSVNAYDAWGIPNSLNQGRFGYTGQAWLPELGMWYYKARIYSPTLGRFMQVDPVGYKDQINLYAYVSNDPLDHTDPTGEAEEESEDKKQGVVATTIHSVEKVTNATVRDFERAGTAVANSVDRMDRSVEGAAERGDRALTAARDAAYAAVGYGTPGKSGVTSAAVHADGSITTGHSTASGGPGHATHPTVAAALAKVPHPSPYHGCCGEVHALSNALHAGKNLVGTVMSSVRTYAGKQVPACSSCRWIMNHLGVSWTK